MNLIRFLSSGSRGLTKGAPPLGRYRLPQGRLIPDFGGKTNPFTSNDLPLQEGSLPAADLTARAASTQAAPPSPVALEPKRVRRLTRLGMTLSGAFRTVMARLKPLSVQLLQSGKRLPGAIAGRIRPRKVRAPFAASAAPVARGPVQAELSLENVRVVRNDLTDTDYEVVRSETTTASPIKRAPKTVAVSPQPRPLSRLAERLFSQKTS